jgi:hypothetical protein
MEKEFIPYKQALALKQLGFNEPCFGYYDLNHNLQFMYNGKPEKFTERRMGVSDSKWVGWISAPLYQQAFRFFREKYKLDKTIDSWTEQPTGDEIWDKAYQYYINGEAYHPYFKTYEEAEIECLKKLIEIVKEK